MGGADEHFSPGCELTLSQEKIPPGKKENKKNTTISGRGEKPKKGHTI